MARASQTSWPEFVALTKRVEQLEDSNKTLLAKFDALANEMAELRSNAASLASEQSSALGIAAGQTSTKVFHIHSSDILNEFTERYWSMSNVSVTPDKTLIGKAEWTMPKRDPMKKVLQIMNCNLTEVRQNGIPYNIIEFTDKSTLPEQWSNYCSWKWAVKVQHFLNLKRSQQCNISGLHEAYHCFTNRDTLLQARLLCLVQYVYEIVKATWTRTFVNQVCSDNEEEKGGKGKRKLTGHSNHESEDDLVKDQKRYNLSVAEQLAAQTPFIQAVLKRAGRECCLFESDVYDESVAAKAMSAVLRSMKNTDVRQAKKFNTMSSDYGKSVIRVNIKAAVPRPIQFDTISNDSGEDALETSLEADSRCNQLPLPLNAISEKIKRAVARQKEQGANRGSSSKKKGKKPVKRKPTERSTNKHQRQTKKSRKNKSSDDDDEDDDVMSDVSSPPSEFVADADGQPVAEFNLKVPPENDGQSDESGHGETENSDESEGDGDEDGIVNVDDGDVGAKKGHVDVGGHIQLQEVPPAEPALQLNFLASFKKAQAAQAAETLEIALENALL